MNCSHYASAPKQLKCTFVGLCDSHLTSNEVGQNWGQIYHLLFIGYVQLQKRWGNLEDHMNRLFKS